MKLADYIKGQPIQQDQLPLEDVVVQFQGLDGNAFSVLAEVDRRIRKAGYPAEVVRQFDTEAKSGDYDKLLQTALKWVKSAPLPDDYEDDYDDYDDYDDED